MTASRIGGAMFAVLFALTLGGGMQAAEEPTRSPQLTVAEGLALTEGLEEFQPTPDLKGTVHCLGAGISMVSLLSLSQAMREIQREMQIEVTPPNGQDRMAALADGTTDLLVLPFLPTADAKRQLAGKAGDDRELVVVPFALNPVVFYVNQRNPLTGLSLDQMRTIIDRKPAEGGRSETWSDVGVAGPLAARPIAVVLTGRDFDQHAAFRRNVLKIGDVRLDARTSPTSAAALSEVAADQAAFCIASLLYATPATRVVPVVTSDHGAVMPDVASVQSGAYPLTTTLTLVAMKQDGRLKPQVREVLRYAISRRAQRQIVSLGIFPITRDMQKQSEDALR